MFEVIFTIFLRFFPLVIISLNPVLAKLYTMMYSYNCSHLIIRFVNVPFQIRTWSEQEMTHTTFA